MIIYNVTIKVDWFVHEAWLQWMKADCIPGILATKLFYGHQFVRLLEVDDTDGPTYAVQYHAHTLEDYNRYISEQFAWQQEKATALWGMAYMAFGTVMEVVH